MQYLQSKNICHRDIKLENILFDQQLNIKLVDFGIASFQGSKMLSDFCGTGMYIAPEIREYRAYDGFKSDVFSLGVVLFALITGYLPFQQAKLDEKYYSLLSCNP